MTCEVCGTDYTPRRGNANPTTCSRACTFRRGRALRPCLSCGEVIPKPPTHNWNLYATRKYCSHKCQGEATTKKVTVPCGVCQVPVTRSPALAKSKHGLVFCSPKCQYAARGLGVTPRIVTNPYQVSDEGEVAQREGVVRGCARRKAEGRYGCSPETRAKLSVSVSRAIADGRFPRVSRLEHRVAALLDAMGVSYLRQHPFREANGTYGAVADFYLPEWCSVIEVNGTYWHADPRVYPNGPIHACQRRTLSRYERKVALLAKVGVQVAEVWEQDFNESPQEAVQMALSSIFHGSKNVHAVAIS